MEKTIIYLAGLPETAREVEGFACFVCDADDELFWCGQWECAQHRCCPDCAVDLGSCECEA